MAKIRLQDTGAERRPKKQMHQRTYKDSRYNGRKWRGLREFIIKKNPTCIQCGRAATVVDHINPVRLGGSFYDLDNLASMCAPCHNSKSALERHQQPEGGRGGS